MQTSAGVVIFSQAKLTCENLGLTLPMPKSLADLNVIKSVTSKTHIMFLNNMPKLSSNQLQEYNDNGYVAPIEVLSKDEAFEIRKEIENIETKWPDELKGAGRNYVHMISPILDEVCHNSKMLDAVESIIGKNIL